MYMCFIFAASHTCTLNAYLSVVETLPSAVRDADSPEYGTDIVVDDMRSTIQGLADHVVYGMAFAKHLSDFISTRELKKTLMLCSEFTCAADTRTCFICKDGSTFCTALPTFGAQMFGHFNSYWAIHPLCIHVLLLRFKTSFVFISF